MNLKNLKKIYRIDKRIVLRKLTNKISNLILDKLYFLRDNNLSTYSLDYISYYKTEINELNLTGFFYINQENSNLEEYVTNCLNHRFSILSDKMVDVNRNANFESLQQNFNKKLIPFSTKCFNLISSDYNIIDWQKDYNSGHNWEWKWFKHISYGNNDGSDIKVPWEIGRLQHLPNLALVYKKSGDEKILLEIKNQILDFMASNPPNFGVQWMTSMDIGIRLINLLFTLQLLNGLHIFNKNEFELIDSYLFDHFLHIKNNIEFSEGMRGNHYLSNLCSLIIYLLNVKTEDSQNQLLKKYLNLLENELDFQFYDDGTNFEVSTRYHIFTSQMLVTTDILLREMTNHRLNEEKLNKICSFTMKLLQYEFPPQIGDNDSGFYWKINNSEMETYNSLRNIILNRYKTDMQSKPLNNGYIERKYDNYDLIIKCGKVGQNGKGGHDHNDNLTYLLYFHGSPFIVDIGSYCYTNDYQKRNYYRASKQHNVMTIGDYEQNEFSDENINDMFWLYTNKSKPKILEITKNQFTGQIDYCGKPYVREIINNSKDIVVIDSYDKDIEKNISVHLHPDISIDTVEKGVYKLFKEENSIILETFDSKVELSDYLFSLQYGVEVIAKKITISSSNKLIKHKIIVEKN